MPAHPATALRRAPDGDSCICGCYIHKAWFSSMATVPRSAPGPHVGGAQMSARRSLRPTERDAPDACCAVVCAHPGLAEAPWVGC